MHWPVGTKVAVLAAALLALTAPAALAAGAFDKNSVPANADVDVVLSASVENLGIYDDSVVLDVPGGFRIVACHDTPDFHCAQSAAGRPSHPVLTWTRLTPGAPVPLAADQLPFRMHTTDRAGQYVFSVHQHFSDGTAEDSAPKLTVTAPAGARATTTTMKSAPAHSASASTKTTAARRVATVTPVSEPDAPWLADTDSADAPPIEIGTEHRVTQSPGMFVAGAIAAVLAGGVFWLRRRASEQSSL